MSQYIKKTLSDTFDTNKSEIKRQSIITVHFQTLGWTTILNGYSTLDTLWKKINVHVLLFILLLRFFHNFYSYFLTLIHSLVLMNVRASRMIGQPPISIRHCLQTFEALHPTLILSILMYYLSISFSLCLSFSPPCIVPCRIIFASPVDVVMCTFHLKRK